MKMKLPEFKKSLFYQLPDIFRYKDNGDLEKYLEACGDLLDKMYGTIAAKMADNFPDTPLQANEDQEKETLCQDWVLPYFAKLLDVKLLSPVAAGKRDEISKAVSWRKKKGTLLIIKEIAESVGQIEIEIQEGWKRVATTPVIGRPLLPAMTFGYSGEPDKNCSAVCSKHPGLPSVTIDFRSPSGAVRVDEKNPGVKYTKINGQVKMWRQTSFHGAPCFPDTYEDVSRRTVDLRNCAHSKGYYHPGRLLLFTPPASGFFPDEFVALSWNSRGSEAFERYVEVSVDKYKKIITYRNRSYGSSRFQRVKIRRVIELGDIYCDSLPDDYTYKFIGLHLDNTLVVHSGSIELEKCAVRRLEVHSKDRNRPVITARSSLFKNIQAASGLVSLEYCTVLEKCLSELIQASDCIFMGIIHKDHHSASPPEAGCVRYSYINENQVKTRDGIFSGPVFNGAVAMYSTKFGEKGCGVLQPESSRDIRQGAEQGGEIGAFHEEFLSARNDAVIEKLKDYLPLNLEAVVISDERLLNIPLE